MPSPNTFDDFTYRLALAAVEAASDRKAGEILLLDVQDISTLADYFLLVTGYSTTQVRAIANAIQDKLLEQESQTPRHIEGLQSSTWILLDYSDVIIHVLTPQEREFYDLDTFWSEARPVDLPIAG
ncbi:MAG: ribosome silencing factor [Synechococcaceae cyanobacterium SM2_3_2]|nr:ribosome silencing factor [Synechococcaceae cyanobacterium SM2_3_2]